MVEVALDAHPLPLLLKPSVAHPVIAHPIPTLTKPRPVARTPFRYDDPVHVSRRTNLVPPSFGSSSFRSVDVTIPKDCLSRPKLLDH